MSLIPNPPYDVPKYSMQAYKPTLAMLRSVPSDRRSNWSSPCGWHSNTTRVPPILVQCLSECRTGITRTDRADCWRSR